MIGLPCLLEVVSHVNFWSIKCEWMWHVSLWGESPNDPFPSEGGSFTILVNETHNTAQSVLLMLHEFIKKARNKKIKIIDPWHREFNWILAILYVSVRTPENVRNPIMTGQQLEIWGYSISVISRAPGQPLSNKILVFVSTGLNTSFHCSLLHFGTRAIVSPALCYGFAFPAPAYLGHLLIHVIHGFFFIPSIYLLSFASSSDDGFYKFHPLCILNFKL